MTAYLIDYHAKGSAEVVDLPDHAFELLVDKLVAVARHPWDETDPDDSESPQYRVARFGQHGLVLVFIDDDSRVVRVHGVLWAG